MRRRRGGVAPIYVFLLLWLGWSLLVPLLRLGAVVLGLAVAIGGAAAVAGFVSGAFKKGRKAGEQAADAGQAAWAAGKAQNTASAGAGVHAPQAAARPSGNGQSPGVAWQGSSYHTGSASDGSTPQGAPAPKPEEKKPSYGEAVDKILAEGELAYREMEQLRSSIRNEAVRSKILQIEDVADKIVKDAIDDPADLPQIRKFLDYYLPTTIKLLHAYDRMDAQMVEGENITGTKQSIEEMLDTTIEAYKKQLDALFANQALDVDAEIRAMNSMLAREGFGSNNLDIKEFMKKYEQKGTTSNG